MSPFLGLSLNEKRKGPCLVRTFGPSSGDAQGRWRTGGWRGGAGRDSVGRRLPFLLRSAGALNDLTPADFAKVTDPLALFKLWLEEASGTEINDPEAMTLATVDAEGLPDARMVLCKGADDRGLVFYTNIESAKGRELKGQPRAAALFHWKSLRRQIRFRGAVSEVTAVESDAYFASRPRGSQIGAWASSQSRPLASRADLEAAVQAYERRFAASDVPRPEYWCGYRLAPVEIEFWRDRPSRLHERVIFTRSAPESTWKKRLLYP
jgi:pyridoxamine 5'-phosphate oxidase